MTGTNPYNPQAEALFRKRYGSCGNLMTPRVWARRMIAKRQLAVELAAGNGIGHEHSRNNDTLWGVTVLLARDVYHHLDLNQSFGTRAEAEAYIENLRSWREPGGAD